MRPETFTPNPSNAERKGAWPISWRAPKATSFEERVLAQPGAPERVAAIESEMRGRLRRSGHSVTYTRTIEFESSDSPERVGAELERALGHLWPNVRVR